MRLPAVAIAALFACGAVLGQWQCMAQRSSSHFCLVAGFVFAGLFICGGIVLARIGRLFCAAAISMLCWLVIGLLAAVIALQPRPSGYVLNQVNAGRLELKTPLRWHGQLRDEPARLPWGYGYEVELSGVEYQGALVPARGGLRISFTDLSDQVAPPDVHAGDEIVVAAQARRPQVYRDDGAFDRRAYLEQQNIDLIATLRALQLMERTGSSKITPLHHPGPCSTKTARRDRCAVCE